jgi:hypothetical protein
MPVDISNWITVTINGLSQDGEPFANVTSFKSNTNTTDPAVLSGLATAFWTALGPTYLGGLCTGALVQSVVARTHYSPPYVEGRASQTFPQYGTINADALPDNTAEVISWKTAYIGRRYRGRTFYPATSETNTATDRYLSGFMSLLGTYAARMLTGFTFGGVTITPAIASRVGVVLNVLTGFLIDFFIEEVRDRLPKHHRHKRRHPTE